MNELVGSDRVLVMTDYGVDRFITMAGFAVVGVVIAGAGCAGCAFALSYALEDIPKPKKAKLSLGLLVSSIVAGVLASVLAISWVFGARVALWPIYAGFVAFALLFIFGTAVALSPEAKVAKVAEG